METKRNGVVLVARDVAPSAALRRVGDVLSSQGHAVAQHLGFGKALKSSVDMIVSAVKEAAVVVCGMSANAKLSAEEVEAATTAVECGATLGFYCDTFGCHSREWFAKFRGRTNVKFLFHVNAQEARDAEQFFPNAVAYAPCNPEVEDAFYSTANCREVRAKLGVQGDEYMVLLNGHKAPMITVPMLVASIQALHTAQIRQHMRMRYKLFFSPHPGDPTLDEKSGYPEPEVFYGDLVQFGGVSLTLLPGKRVDKGNVLPVNDLIVGCDVLVAPASGSERTAACLRKPVIAFLSEISLARNVTVFGKREWELAEMGTSMPIYGCSAEGLAHAIDQLTRLPSSWDFQEMRRCQEEAFQPPEKQGEAVRVMATVIGTEHALARRG